MGFFSDFLNSLRRFFSGAGSSMDASSGHRLYVGNLSYQVREDELRALFSKYGKVKTLHLIRDRITRRLKGYAFLEMSPQDAMKAISLNGADFLGRKLVVSIAKDKKSGDAPERQSGGQQRRPNHRWKKNRSGPRVYGESKEDTPLKRYE